MNSHKFSGFMNLLKNTLWFHTRAYLKAIWQINLQSIYTYSCDVFPNGFHVEIQKKVREIIKTKN